MAGQVSELAIRTRLGTPAMTAPVLCPDGHLYDSMVWNHVCPICGSEEGSFLEKTLMVRKGQALPNRGQARLESGVKDGKR